MPLRDLRTFIRQMPRVAADESLEAVHRHILAEARPRDRKPQLDAWTRLARGGATRRHRSTAKEIEEFARSAGVSVEIHPALPTPPAPVQRKRRAKQKVTSG